MLDLEIKTESNHDYEYFMVGYGATPCNNNYTTLGVKCYITNKAKYDSVECDIIVNEKYAGLWLDIHCVISNEDLMSLRNSTFKCNKIEYDEFLKLMKNKVATGKEYIAKDSNSRRMRNYLVERFKEMKQGCVDERIKLCPFRLSTIHLDGDNSLYLTPNKNQHQDVQHFERCLGEQCMKYVDGRCTR